jgi:uncharacterized protein (UPF0332 family)
MVKKAPKAVQIERAHHWIVKSLDALEEARVLIPSGKTRSGAYSRLYYSAHHAAVALLRLIGNKAKTHSSVKAEFGKAWVKRRGFPPTYGKILKSLSIDRTKADYGEFVPSMKRDLDSRYKTVYNFIKRAQKEIPPISTAKILLLLVAENPEIRDLSFDIYCPKTYYHHTRFTSWCPKGRVTDKWLNTLLSQSIKMLQTLRVKESKEYVIGLNSRINQYEDYHIIMLDFDDVSSIPFDKFKGEPGFFFRTHSGFHFIGSKLYTYNDWAKTMKKHSKLASTKHYELSIKRGYATLRLTASPRKPVAPAYIGRSE